MRTIALALTLLATTPLFATSAIASDCSFGISVRFIEGAPVDRFEITAKGERDWQIQSLTFDLASAVGNIIFDPTATGAGVDAFAPFVQIGSSATLAQQPKLADGDQTLALSFSDFQPGQSYAFSVDIDDQLTNSDRGQIQVSGRELDRARLSANVERAAAGSPSNRITYAGAFGANNRAVLGDDCSN